MEKSLDKPITAKSIAEYLTPEETRRILKEDLMSENDPRQLIKKFRTEILPTYLAKKKRTKADLMKFSEIADKAMMALGPDTHLPLLLTVRENYQPLILELVRRIEKEYDCQSVSEVMLAEVVATSHARALDLSNRFTNLYNLEFLSHEQNGYYGLMGKEIDRAHRRMMHALSLLRQMRQPSVEVNIKTKNAFVAQNQQINTSGPENPLENTKNEINEPK